MAVARRRYTAADVMHHDPESVRGRGGPLLFGPRLDYPYPGLPYGTSGGRTSYPSDRKEWMKSARSEAAAMRKESRLIDESIKRAERKLKWHKAQGHSGSMRSRPSMSMHAHFLVLARGGDGTPGNSGSGPYREFSLTPGEVATWPSLAYKQAVRVYADGRFVVGPFGRRRRRAGAPRSHAAALRRARGVR